MSPQQEASAKRNCNACGCAAWERPPACERERLLYEAECADECSRAQQRMHEQRPWDSTAAMLAAYYAKQAAELRAAAERLVSVA